MGKNVLAGIGIVSVASTLFFAGFTMGVWACIRVSINEIERQDEKAKQEKKEA